MYTTKRYIKTIAINDLLNHYDHEKVENYCKNCDNYNKIWSCPPHNFNTYDFINQFSKIELHLEKINLPQSVSKDQVLNIFAKARRTFSDDIMSREKEGMTAVIAGNCYMCKTCQRTSGKACILKDDMRYSLESIGLIVGEIAEMMGVPLVWTSGTSDSYLVTVGGLFMK